MFAVCVGTQCCHVCCRIDVSEQDASSDILQLQLVVMKVIINVSEQHAAFILRVNMTKADQLESLVTPDST